MPAFAVVTMGCKVNQYDSEGIAQALTERGWTRADDGQPPELCIINTCTVTGGAAMQARQAIRQAVRKHPTSRILVTGCYAETDADAVMAIEGVDLVVGNSNKHRIVDQLCDSFPIESIPETPDPSREFHHMPVDGFAARSRPFLKIQDGCDAHCTYCIVPRARGASRSMSPEQVLGSLHRFGEAGYKEVVLTGIHLGNYGSDCASALSLTGLLEKIVANPPVRRIRLSSIEPNEVTDGMLDLIASSDTICPHFHIPLQSGDDGILRRMNRPYSVSVFTERIKAIARRFPDAAIGADVLLGFPGETDAAADNTHSLIAALPITYLHVFPFSPRPGTPAARYPNPVPGDIVRRRCRQMRQLGESKRAAFVNAQTGRIRPVLVESNRHAATGLLVGVSDNYIRVRFEGPDEWMGCLMELRLSTDASGQCIGAVDTLPNPG